MPLVCVHKESTTILQGPRLSCLSVESGVAPHLTELEQWPTGCWMTETHGEDRTLTKAGRLDHPAGACAENRLAAKSRVRPSPGATDAPAKQGLSSGAE